MSDHTAWGNIYAKPVRCYYKGGKGIFIKRCPICGKKFEIYSLDSWAYAVRTYGRSHKKALAKKCFCSWGVFARVQERERKMMEKLGEFTIAEKLPSFNDVISANRTNRYKGSTLKKDIQDKINRYIVKAMAEGTLKPITKPCVIYIDFTEKTHKRDVDNVQSGQKFILDSLVSMQILPNDNPRWVRQVFHTVSYASKNEIHVSIYDFPGCEQDWIDLATWAGKIICSGKNLI